MKGKIIVFEGLDGCGKTTQIEEFKKYLNENGIKFKYVKFPVYDNPTSIPIKEYLSGDLKTTIYQISAFYATDRLYSYISDWKKEYENGGLILLDRYTYSNAIFQGAKCSNLVELEKYIKWLEYFEFSTLELPSPDITVFLDISTKSSQNLMSKRYDGDESKKDVHERNIEYQEKCRKVANFISMRNHWKKIKVDANNGQLRNIKDISEEIVKKVFN